MYDYRLIVFLVSVSHTHIPVELCCVVLGSFRNSIAYIPGVRQSRAAAIAAAATCIKYHSIDIVIIIVVIIIYHHHFSHHRFGVSDAVD